MMKSNRNKKSKGSRFGNRDTHSHHMSKETENFNRIVGILLISTMILSVVCSIWFGWKIRKGLTDLEHQKISSKHLGEKASLLKERRASLMTRDIIEKKASVLGLRKPEPKQIIRP